MVASRGNTTNPARIPALGLRTLALFFMSLLLMVLDHRDNHLNNVRDAIEAAVYPVQVIVDAPARLWVWASENTQSRNELELENARLRAEKLLTSARLLELESLKAENDRLRSMLEARQQVKNEVRVAEIMSVDPNPYRHSIVIDVGSRDGVYDSQAIVDSDGVVGQVMEAGPMSSQALLISDPDHTLPVEVLRNGLRTVAFGTGDFGRLDLPFLPNNADIREGDLLVTSGLGGAFPPGYPVATVDTILRIPQEAYADVSARPLAALNQVREVMLIWSGGHGRDANGDDAADPSAAVDRDAPPRSSSDPASGSENGAGDDPGSNDE